MTTLLDLIKSNAPGPERLAIIVNDHEAQKVLVAWMDYGPLCHCPDRQAGKKEDLLTAWHVLWDGMRIDYQELSRRSGVPATICERAMYKMKCANLIYPDGTVATVSLQLVSGLMQANIKGYVKRGRS